MHAPSSGDSRPPAETVLITGASSGIGLELARCFAAEGCRVVLTARNETALRELADELSAAHGVSAIVLPCDLAQPDAPEQLAQACRQGDLVIDVLVNNAGFGAHGPVSEIPLERQREMVQLNTATLMELSRRFLPGMLERGRGGVLNVASTAAFQPGPRMAVYFATKAFVLSFTEALAEELSGTGVAASCLCPGPTETGFISAADMHDSRLFRLGMMTAQAVARAGHRGFRRGKVVVIPGLGNKAGTWLVRFAPRIVVRKFTGWLVG
jgi:hypothetical protein